MKHFIFILAAALLLSVPAYAQLDIKKVGEKPKKVATLEAMWNWLIIQQGTWYFEGKTDNQFDDHFFITLGDDARRAAKSVMQLQQLLRDMGDDDVFEITDREEQPMTLSVYYAFGKRYGFRLHRSGLAGTGYIYKDALDKAMVELNKAIREERQNVTK